MYLKYFVRRGETKSGKFKVQLALLWRSEQPHKPSLFLSTAYIISNYSHKSMHHLPLHTKFNKSHETGLLMLAAEGVGIIYACAPSGTWRQVGFFCTQCGADVLPPGGRKLKCGEAWGQTWKFYDSLMEKKYKRAIRCACNIKRRQSVNRSTGGMLNSVKCCIFKSAFAWRSGRWIYKQSSPNVVRGRIVLGDLLKIENEMTGRRQNYRYKTNAYMHLDNKMSTDVIAVPERVNSSFVAKINQHHISV